jgi:hypothetical protein
MILRRALLFLFLYFALSAACAQDAKEQYLLQNRSELDVNDNEDYSSFAMLDTVVDRYRVFFTGETHDQEGNMELKWKMLKYLYKKAGVRVLVLEDPASYAWLLNKHIASGDSVKYNHLIEYETSAKERIFFRTLYRFNRALPPEERIILYGIDMEYSTTIAAEALDSIINERPVPPSLRSDIQSFTKDHKYEWADTVLKKLENDPSMKAYYGKNYLLLTSILRGMACSTCDPPEIDLTSSKWIDRENLMHHNYLDLIEQYPHMKYYGQFGKAHTNIRPGIQRWFRALNWFPLASRLNTLADSPVKEQVCSIVIEYSYGISGKGDSKYFYNTSAPGFTLFKLDRPDCPFDTLHKYFNYVVNNLFYDKEQNEYNKLNDHYGIMKLEKYKVQGFTVGYQHWDEPMITFGYTVRHRQVAGRYYSDGYQFMFEFNPTKRLHSYVITSSVAFGKNENFYVGISPVFSTTYRKNGSLFLIRPEAGFQWKELSIGYGYNYKPFNNTLPGSNTHLVTLKALLPVFVE